MTYYPADNDGFPNRAVAHPALTDEQFNSACFVVAYVRLLHAEAHIVSHIIEGLSLKDLVDVHNILETARCRVVEAYLPFRKDDGRRLVEVKKS